jgi:carbonic anhydrase
MSYISTIMEFNQSFVENKEYEQFITDKFPDKKIVILTCMDTRLVELLPRAMNMRNGDAIIVKSAGAVVSQPFGAVMRSIIVAIYELNAEEVYVIGHNECGMTALNADRVIEKAKSNGISEEVMQTINNSGIKLHKWLSGFEHTEDGVIKSVRKIRNHPLVPKHIPVHGMIIDSETGKLTLLCEDC